MAPASALATTPFQQKLEEAIQNFKKRKLAANKYVIESFRNERRKVSRNRSLSEATRAEYKKRIDRYIRNFERSGKFPNIVESVEMEIEYQTRLDRAFVPISKLLERELKRANRSDDQSYSEQLLQKKRLSLIHI